MRKNKKGRCKSHPWTIYSPSYSPTRSIYISHQQFCCPQGSVVPGHESHPVFSGHSAQLLMLSSLSISNSFLFIYFSSLNYFQSFRFIKGVENNAKNKSPRSNYEQRPPLDGTTAYLSADFPSSFGSFLLNTSRNLESSR